MARRITLGADGDDDPSGRAVHQPDPRAVIVQVPAGRDEVAIDGEAEIEVARAAARRDVEDVVAADHEIGVDDERHDRDRTRLQIPGRPAERQPHRHVAQRLAGLVVPHHEHADTVPRGDRQADAARHRDVFGLLPKPHHALRQRIHQLAAIEVDEVEVMDKAAGEGLTGGVEDLHAQALQQRGHGPVDALHQTVAALHMHRHVAHDGRGRRDDERPHRDHHEMPRRVDVHPALGIGGRGRVRRTQGVEGHPQRGGEGKARHGPEDLDHRCWRSD